MSMIDRVAVRNSPTSRSVELIKMVSASIESMSKPTGVVRIIISITAHVGIAIPNSGQVVRRVNRILIIEGMEEIKSLLLGVPISRMV